jgi:hypothetical protein
MNRFSIAPFLLLLLASFAGPMYAVNIMSFIESARCTPVVYVGAVREVKENGRDKFKIWDHARIDVKVVGRGGDNAPPQVGSFFYPSYDAKTPHWEGGPEYVLHPGTWVLVFSRQFDDPDQPSYLRSGTREELTKLIRTFADEAAAMDDEQLKFNMISAAQRDQQIELYRHMLEQLTALP